MERRNYIPPIAFNRNQNLPPLLPTPPSHFMIANSTTSVHHRQTQLLYTENQRLAAANVSLAQSLSAAQQELRHLSATAVKVKAEREAKVREVSDRAAKMEAELKLIDESNAELVKTLAEVRKLESENEELEKKLKKVRDDVAEVEDSDEWKQIPVVKAEIETMRKEVERGRVAIEHERRVYDSSVNQGLVMENYKILMAAEIMKQQVEVSDAGKRDRAAAALAAAEVSDPRKRARAAATLKDVEVSDPRKRARAAAALEAVEVSDAGKRAKAAAALEAVEISDAEKRARAAAALEAVEVSDAKKRARAAAALEAPFIPCTSQST